MAPRTDFELSFNRFLDQFKLISDRFWADICSLQEPLFIIFRSILDHFRLMSDRSWIDIYSILTWIGLMFTRCGDRFSSDLNKAILTLIATRPPPRIGCISKQVPLDAIAPHPSFCGTQTNKQYNRICNTSKLEIHYLADNVCFNSTNYEPTQHLRFCFCGKLDFHASLMTS